MKREFYSHIFWDNYSSEVPCYIFSQAVQPSAGNIVYDQFTDSVDGYGELEMRLTHVQPVELLYPTDSSKRLEQVLMDWKVYSGR